MYLRIAALVTAALTVINIGIAVFNIFYTQRRSDRREVIKWSSDNLLKLISKLVQLSSERQSIYMDALRAIEESRVRMDRERHTEEMVWEMELLQTRLLNDDVATHADAIYRAHRTSEDEYASADWEALELGFYEQANTLIVSDLPQLHQAVIDSFRKVAEAARVGGNRDVKSSKNPHTYWLCLARASSLRSPVLVDFVS